MFNFQIVKKESNSKIFWAKAHRFRLLFNPSLKSLCENKNIDGSRPAIGGAITALFRNLKVATTDIFRILTQPLKAGVTED